MRCRKLLITGALRSYSCATELWKQWFSLIVRTTCWMGLAAPRGFLDERLLVPSWRAFFVDLV